jgi:hypothetical protein
MSVQLKVEEDPSDLKLVLKDKHVKKVKLAIRKTLDGNFLVKDHQTIDVVIMPDKGKILAMPKGEFNEDTYADQDQMFKFLVDAGVVQPESIIGGNIFGSIEGKFNTQKIADEEPLEVVILNIANFIKKDKGEYSVRRQFIDALERELLNPDEESTTELGEVPQEKFKGSIPMHGFPTRGIYRYNY